tara:strand:+ start:221 stop:433 length:213 start_codon:yes stop_codon:yes gene_type:complete
MATVEELVEKNGRVGGTLIGVDSNAGFIIAHTQTSLRRGGWPSEDIKEIVEIALGGDYSNVIATCAAVFD